MTNTWGVAAPGRAMEYLPLYEMRFQAAGRHGIAERVTARCTVCMADGSYGCMAMSSVTGSGRAGKVSLRINVHVNKLIDRDAFTETAVRPLHSGGRGGPVTMQFRFTH